MILGEWQRERASLLGVEGESGGETARPIHRITSADALGSDESPLLQLRDVTRAIHSSAIVSNTIAAQQLQFHLYHGTEPDCIHYTNDLRAIT